MDKVLEMNDAEFNKVMEERIVHLKTMINELLEKDRQRIAYKNFIGYFKDEGLISETRYNKIIKSVEG